MQAVPTIKPGSLATKQAKTVQPSAMSAEHLWSLSRSDQKDTRARNPHGTPHQALQHALNSQELAQSPDGVDSNRITHVVDALHPDEQLAIAKFRVENAREITHAAHGSDKSDKNKPKQNVKPKTGGVGKNPKPSGGKQKRSNLNTTTLQGSTERIISKSSTNHSGCASCRILTQQVCALTQSLAGLSMSVVRWAAQTTGLTFKDRQSLKAIVVQYVEPCACSDASLEFLLLEIKHDTSLLDDERASISQSLSVGEVATSDAAKVVKDQQDSNRRKFTPSESGQHAYESKGATQDLASTVTKGVLLVSRAPADVDGSQDAEVYKSFDSFAVVDMIPAGSRVVAAGPAQDCGGFWMVPIVKPQGVVDLKLFEVAETPAPFIPKDAGKSKKKGFFSRLVTRGSRVFK